MSGARAKRPPPGSLRPSRGQSGQSALETVALLPLLIAVALAIGHVLSAGLAREMAGHAAEAGAIAVLRGGDPKAAVRAALPEWSRDHVSVRVAGGRVRVRLEPSAIVPGVADLLASTAVADVGPSRAGASGSAGGAGVSGHVEADTPPSTPPRSPRRSAIRHRASSSLPEHGLPSSISGREDSSSSAGAAAPPSTARRDASR